MLRQTRNFHYLKVVGARGLLRNTVVIERFPTLLSNTHRTLFESLPTSHTCCFFSSTTVGRSRKRRIPLFKSEKSVMESDTDDSPPSVTPTPGINNQTVAPYPKGQPWRVLWPRPHGCDSSPPPPKRRIPRLQDFRRAWYSYKETWKYGLSGVPPKGTTIRDTPHGAEGVANDIDFLSLKTTTTEDVADNAKRNLRLIREDAQELLEHTKERTGIRTQEDVKALASEMMQLATEGIREFMAGYRQGRDEEIDKMLHEYFKDPTTNDGSERKHDDKSRQVGGDEKSTDKPRKKRKPKRGIPRE